MKKNIRFYLLLFILSSMFFGGIGVFMCVSLDFCIDLLPSMFGIHGDVMSFLQVILVSIFVSLSVYVYRNFLR